MIIGERLKEARLRQGLSQQELGDLLGVSKVSVCGYEKGNRTPTIETFLDLIRVLNLDVRYVLGQDVLAVAEEDEKYQVNIATADLRILSELKQHRELYNALCSDPRRVIEKISKKV